MANLCNEVNVGFSVRSETPNLASLRRSLKFGARDSIVLKENNEKQEVGVTFDTKDFKPSFLGQDLESHDESPSKNEYSYELENNKVASNRFLSKKAPQREGQQDIKFPCVESAMGDPKSRRLCGETQKNNVASIFREAPSSAIDPSVKKVQCLARANHLDLVSQPPLINERFSATSRRAQSTSMLTRDALDSERLIDELDKSRKTTSKRSTVTSTSTDMKEKAPNSKQKQPASTGVRKMGPVSVDKFGPVSVDSVSSSSSSEDAEIVDVALNQKVNNGGSTYTEEKLRAEITAYIKSAPRTNQNNETVAVTVAKQKSTNLSKLSTLPEVCKGRSRVHHGGQKLSFSLNRRRGPVSVDSVGSTSSSELFCDVEHTTRTGPVSVDSIGSSSSSDLAFFCDDEESPDQPMRRDSDDSPHITVEKHLKVEQKKAHRQSVPSSNGDETQLKRIESQFCKNRNSDPCIITNKISSAKRVHFSDSHLVVQNDIDTRTGPEQRDRPEATRSLNLIPKEFDIQQQTNEPCFVEVPSRDNVDSQNDSLIPVAIGIDPGPMENQSMAEHTADADSVSSVYISSCSELSMEDPIYKVSRKKKITSNADNVCVSNVRSQLNICRGPNTLISPTSGFVPPTFVFFEKEKDASNLIEI